MAMMVADTDVLIDFLENRPPAAARVAIELEHGQLGTTAITGFELLAGARTARQRKAVGELIAGLPCLPLDGAGADSAAEIRRAFEGAGVLRPPFPLPAPPHRCRRGGAEPPQQQATV
jgi:predicted nucleic acid-binding protein